MAAGSFDHWESRRLYEREDGSSATEFYAVDVDGRAMFAPGATVLVTPAARGGRLEVQVMWSSSDSRRTLEDAWAQKRVLDQALVLADQLARQISREAVADLPHPVEEVDGQSSDHCHTCDGRYDYDDPIHDDRNDSEQMRAERLAGVE